MRSAVLYAGLLPAVFAGCDGGYDGSGRSEPITVRSAVFHEGALPVDEGATTPLISYATSVGSVVTQGQGNISYSGLASTDTYSIAVTFPGVSTGYWVVPAGNPDATQGGALSFKTVIDFKPDVPYGLQTLSFSAIDGEGRAGPRYDASVCILPDVANNNLAACTDSVSPQSAVLSLTWDTNVDLDLVVVAPNGKVVSSKAPTTALPGEDGTYASETLNDPTTGRISRDSNANCVIDSINLESLIFLDDPPAGDYAVYADLFSDCGQPYANYQLTLFQRTEADDGTQPVVSTDLAYGELLAAQADGGEALGTYVTTVTFP